MRTLIAAAAIAGCGLLMPGIETVLRHLFQSARAPRRPRPTSCWWHAGAAEEVAVAAPAGAPASIVASTSTAASTAT